MPTAPSLEERVRALELSVGRTRRQLSRSRRFSAALLLTLVAGACLAATNLSSIADIVQAKRFEVVDDQGQLIVALGAGERGDGQIDIWTAGGQNVLRLSANRHGGDINLWNLGGTAVFGAYATRSGASNGVWTGEGQRVVQIGSSDDGAGQLTLSNAAARPSVVAAAGAAGGSVRLLNGEGQALVEHEAATNGGQVRLNRPDGQTGLEGRIADDGSGQLAVSDALGQPRGTLGLRDGGGFVQLLNTAGQPVVRAGALSETTGGFVNVANDRGVGVVRIAANADGCGRLDLSNEVGNSVFFADGVKNVGSLMAMISATGQRMFVVGTTPDGGLMNLINSTGVSNVIVGPAEDGRGGAISIRNGRGIEVLQAGTGEDDHGRLLIRNADGERERVVVPGR